MLICIHMYSSLPPPSLGWSKEADIFSNLALTQYILSGADHYFKKKELLVIPKILLFKVTKRPQLLKPL